MTGRDPFDTIREALADAVALDNEWWNGEHAEALAALDELREQLRQAEQAAGAEAQLADESQRWAREQQARADRAEQENRRLREAVTYAVEHWPGEAHLGSVYYGLKDAADLLAASEELR